MTRLNTLRLRETGQKRKKLFHWELHMLPLQWGLKPKANIVQSIKFDSRWVMARTLTSTCQETKGSLRWKHYLFSYKTAPKGNFLKHSHKCNCNEWLRQMLRGQETIQSSSPALILKLYILKPTISAWPNLHTLLHASVTFALVWKKKLTGCTVAETT